jgi:hypothetical protein
VVAYGMPSTNWIAIGVAFFLAIFVTLFASHTHAPVVQQPPTGFSSLGTVTNTEFKTLPLPAFIPTTTPIVVPSTTPAKPKPATPAAPTPIAAAAVTAPISTEALNATIGLVRGALVNIICIPSDPKLHAASATGVVIDPRGIILTVAHMAQFYLLADYPQSGDTACIIRAGSPARTAYTASLIYISPEWIENNPKTLVEEVPTGTGEDDFALLAITGSATKTPLPSSFTAIPLSKENPALNEAVTLGSYGAEFLNSTEIRTALYPIVVFSAITDLFTFHAKTEDLVAVTNTAAAQEGSSGGVLVNKNNEAVGLITTSNRASSGVTERTLHAITTNYIRRAFLAETGETLENYLDTSVDALVQGYKQKITDLSVTLEAGFK